LLLNGRLDIKAAPLSPLGLFVAHILPPCTPIIFFEIKSPRPVPFPYVVSNFENSFGAISVSIPEPLSFTITITSRMLLSLLIYNNTIITVILMDIRLSSLIKILYNFKAPLKAVISISTIIIITILIQV
jgi:hypothetical protein